MSLTLILSGCGQGIVSTPPGNGNANTTPPPAPPTPTTASAAIQHVVVIFGENVSFDHYFGTYPNAANPAGRRSLRPPQAPRQFRTITSPLPACSPRIQIRIKWCAHLLNGTCLLRIRSVSTRNQAWNRRARTTTTVLNRGLRHRQDGLLPLQGRNRRLRRCEYQRRSPPMESRRHNGVHHGLLSTATP